MVLQEAKFNKLRSKMEDHLHLHLHLHHHHHHHHHEPLFEAFKADISTILDPLVSTLDPELQSLPLPWIQNCLKTLPSMHGAFAKLSADSNHPMNTWEADNSVEEYLQYSLNLLDLFNSISSALSHLGQSRIVLSHALTLFQENPPCFTVERLKPILPRTHLLHGLKIEKVERNKEDDSKSGSFWISKALVMMGSIGFWVSAVVLSALSGDPNPYSDMRKWIIGSEISSLIDLDSRVEEIMLRKGGVFVTKVAEINDSIGGLVSAIEGGEEDASSRARELQSKVEGLEEMVEEIGKEVDGLFSEIMKSRNELIDCLRIHNQPWKQI